MTNKQYEFIGDRILSLAAIEVIMEDFKGCTYKQFIAWSMELTTNENLGNANSKAEANKVERQIGHAYIMNGINYAVHAGMTMLRNTKRYYSINKNFSFEEA